MNPLLHGNATTSLRRLLGGWRDILDDLSGLCRDLRDVPEMCECGHGPEHLQGSCACCGTLTTMPQPNTSDVDRMEAAKEFAGADHACVFGPTFFLSHLGRFVRDTCPSADDHLPKVEIRLADGESLDLCHIIGVSPRWVMLASRAGNNHQHEMVSISSPSK